MLGSFSRSRTGCYNQKKSRFFSSSVVIKKKTPRKGHLVQVF